MAVSPWREALTVPFSGVRSTPLNDLLVQVADHTDLSAFRVRQYSGLVFLCGGPTSRECEPPRSARDVFRRRIRDKHPTLFQRLFLAEVVSEWAIDMIRERYTPDLLTFESHVSGLASAISLIVESPGSIAELGSFCLLPSVRDRLMIVTRPDWINDSSFISLGPMTYLKERAAHRINPIHIYPWRIYWDSHSKQSLPNLDDLNTHADKFVEDLVLFEQKLTKRPQWNQDNMGHLSLLINDIVRLFLALRISEIKLFLKSMGVTGASIKRIKGHMFLLEKLGFVRKVSYSSNEYYVSFSNQFYIELNMRRAPHEIRDKERFMFLMAQSMKERDKDRYAAIRQSRSNT